MAEAAAVAVVEVEAVAAAEVAAEEAAAAVVVDRPRVITWGPGVDTSEWYGYWPAC